MVSHAHAVCAKDLYIVIISATVETSDPEAEIKPAVELLGGVREMFVKVSTLEEPINDAVAENLYITKSYDATSHFETSDIDVLDIHEKIFKEKLDLNIQATDEDDY
jgi:Rab GDP dissociation inhibitor